MELCKLLVMLQIMLGDGHQPNNRGLYTHYEDSLLKVVATQIFFVFTPNLGEMIQFDEHMFQMGWFKHQRDFVSCFDHVSFPESWCSCPPLTKKKNKWQSPKSRVCPSIFWEIRHKVIFLTNPNCPKIRANYGKFIYGYRILPKFVPIKYLIG